MHELSIVLSIVDIAEQEVHKAGARRVEHIELDIGVLAGVESSALDFAWQSAVQKTVLEKAQRTIHHVAGKARCSDCQREYQLESYYDPCPYCESPFHETLSGRELRVRSLTVT